MTPPPRTLASTAYTPRTSGKGRSGKDQGATRPATAADTARINEIIAGVGSIVPPVWPLDDFVAVNPFVGLSAARFLDARSLLRDVRTCEMLPSARDFLARFGHGDITMADVADALAQCREEYPELYAGFEPQSLVDALEEAAAASVAVGSNGSGRSAAAPEADRRYHTVSEAIDRLEGSSWSSHIVTEISRLLAGHYDRGQAA